MSKKDKSRTPHLSLSHLIQRALDSQQFFYSFEYSASRDPNPDDLFERISRMTSSLKPLWIDVTWGFGNVGQRSIEMCRRVQKNLSVPCLLHFILTDRTTIQLETDLAKARAAGVRSILALRGYTQAGYDAWQPCEVRKGEVPPPQHADGLIRFIKERHQDWFSIGVAGFPEGHPESKDDLDKDVEHLKLKVDAGAEFIICQFCFDAVVFAAFVTRCRDIGIDVPILPGVMPLTEYSTAKLLSETWGVRLTANIEKKLKDCEESGETERGIECGEEFVTELCRDFLRVQSEGVDTTGTAISGGGLHFFVYDAEWEVRRLLSALSENTIDNEKKQHA